MYNELLGLVQFVYVIVIYRIHETILILIKLKCYFSYPQKAILNLIKGCIVLLGPVIHDILRQSDKTTIYQVQFEVLIMYCL